MGRKVLKITQIKSAIGYDKRQKATLKMLGLGKLHRTVEKTATPQIEGMVRKVIHLVSVERLDASPSSDSSTPER